MARLDSGVPVRIREQIASYMGDSVMVRQQYKTARRAGTSGVCHGHVAGHGGDVWWVKHDSGEESIYYTNELMVIAEGRWTPLDCDGELANG